VRGVDLARAASLLAAAVTIALAPAPQPWAGCPGLQAPPPPAAKEEVGAPPAPLPWPAEPVGGPDMGTCGAVGPATPAGIDAVSYVVADLDTGAVLAARAPHARERPASTLKVLLSLVALSRLNPDAVVDGTAADLAVDGSKAGIGPGGRYTVRQLMTGLLLNSGNDTAQALARAMGGTEPTIAAMAAYAQAHGALDTRPATVSGLDGPGMSASAYDLATLFRQALRDPLFAATLKIRTAPFPGYGDKPGFLISSTEQFAPRYPDAIGSKSGFTDAARHTLIAARDHDGRRLVVVLMRGEQHPVPMWKQAAALLDDAFARPEVPVGTLVDTTPAAAVSATPAPVAAPSSGTPDGGSRSPDPVVIGVGGGVVVLALVATAVVLRRRKRS
jgi:serine-type D-Ala-D-Ala carboxypeptidase (penicillin-binding protein 5/6)